MLGHPGAAGALRPLGLGEMLDRAVTLSVRHFWPLAAIYIVYAVPLGVERYAEHDNGFISYLIDLSNRTHGGGTSDARANWALVDFVVTYVISAVPSAALAYAIANRYLGRATTFGRAYLAALGRLPSLVGLALPYVFADVALLAAGVLGIVALAILLSVALHVVRPQVLLFLALPAAVPFAVAVCALVVAQWVSFATLVVEDFDFGAALRAGLRRVFARSNLRRTWAVACAFCAAAVGLLILDLSVHAVLVDRLHYDIIDRAFQTLTDLLSTIFLSAFLTIYYFDLRVRAEAFDLRRAAQEVV
jgi:hypothetical protein